MVLRINAPSQPDIAASINGSIIIGQYNQGVTIFKNGIVKMITRDDGLSDLRIHDTEVDSDGNIWIGTDTGLFKYDGEKMEHFDVDDGLASF